MQIRVFDRFGMINTSMTWRLDLADGYGVDGSIEPHDERRNVREADTNIADQAQLWAGIVRGVGLSDSSRAEMVRPQATIESAHQFPTLMEETNPDNRSIDPAAGLGLVTFQDIRGPAWFKGGHDLELRLVG